MMAANRDMTVKVRLHLDADVAAAIREIVRDEIAAAAEEERIRGAALPRAPWSTHP